MVRREIQSGEIVPVILDLGALGNSEPHASEDIENLPPDDRKRMPRSKRLNHRTGQVAQGISASVVGGMRRFHLLEFLVGQLLQFIEFLAHLSFHLGRHCSEILKQYRDYPLFTEVFQAKLFNFVMTRSGQLADLLLKFSDFFDHGYSIILTVILTSFVGRSPSPF